MTARHTPATVRIQARLERWELDHLRALAAVQAERIEQLETELFYAQSCAESWQDDAMRMQEELAAQTGGCPGLTMGGQLVVVRDNTSLQAQGGAA